MSQKQKKTFAGIVYLRFKGNLVFHIIIFHRVLMCDFYVQK